MNLNMVNNIAPSMSVCCCWPRARAAVLLLSTVTVHIIIITMGIAGVAVEASRAYPHGCLYRHPSYYTYDERDDISWATTIPTTEPLCDHDDELENEVSLASNSNTNNQVVVDNAVVEPPLFLDFRKLPPKSSRLRRPYDRYRLTRRLGAGKFSDVFEAVDVQWEDKRTAVADKKRKKKKKMLQQQQKQRTGSTRHKQDEGEGSSSSSSSSWEGGGIKHGKCGESTEEAEEYTKEESHASENGSKSKQEGDSNNGNGIDPQSLVVLKCLKPVSERKIRRELLVLTHCLTLPNLARVIGIVLPDSMDDDENENETIREAEKEGIRQQQQQQQEEIDVTASGGHHKRRRRQQPSSSSNRLQWENIGSITDAAASTVEVSRPTSKRDNTSTTTTTVSSSTTQSKTKNGSSNTNNNNKQQQQHQTKPKQQNHGTQLPALVLEHAGQKAQWFCHGNTNDSNYLSEYEMKYYLCHLVIALDGLHAAGIMHRDVKPRNTLINRFPNGSGSRNNVNSELMSSSSSSSSVYNSDSDGEQQIVTTTSSTFSMPRQQQTIDPLPPPALMLLDLGLADFYLPGKEYNVRVASRHYKSPELLIGFEYYDYAIDMWSVGCILAGLLFRREPFFRGKDNEDQLGKIVSVLGTRDFLPYCRKCNVRLSSKARAAIGKYCSRAASSSSSSSDGATSLLNNEMGRRKPWLSFLSPTCPIPSPEALDLLDKLLVYDHEQRWTAREALGHSFFDDVRDQVLREVRERAVHESQWRNNVLVQRR